MHDIHAVLLNSVEVIISTILLKASHGPEFAYKRVLHIWPCFAAMLEDNLLFLHIIED